jgi:hypothetical protein
MRQEDEQKDVMTQTFTFGLMRTNMSEIGFRVQYMASQSDMMHSLNRAHRVCEEI